MEIELYEIVTETNPMWDPVERAVTDVRLLAGRWVSDERYEFDAEYEVLSITQRPRHPFIAYPCTADDRAKCLTLALIPDPAAPVSGGGRD